MRGYDLTFTRIPSPQYFQTKGGQVRTKVGEDGHVLHFGESLKFVGENLAPGTEIVVYENLRGPYCILAEDYDERVREREAAEAARKERERIALNAKRVEGEALIASLHLPVRWETGIKDVLSGLSARSWGNGRSRATVEHIRLLEPLKDGRLKREAGDFLCTSAGGTNGQQYIDPRPEMFLDGEGQRYMAAPSCTACLKFAKKYIKSEPEGPQS